MPDNAAPPVHLQEHYLASMPNLAFTGLSENWLLKECGHQHWLALAALYGRPIPDFRDPQGRIAYAAFTQVKCQGLQLQAITENRTFTLETRLWRVAQNRHFSEQRLLLRERCVGQIALTSAFISRHTPGDNRSVAKACLKDAPAMAIASDTPWRQLHGLGKQIRNGDWHNHFQLDRDSCVALPGFSFTPCPDIDYNGAELFYFANFQALVERTEWQVLGLRRPGYIRQREIHYYGNLNLHDNLLVQLHIAAPGQFTPHWCEVFRQSDGAKLADVFSEKTWPSECSRP
ncbi:Pnap_2097 family protein [Pseudomonas sp. X10]